jgi:hypothetical protein
MCEYRLMVWAEDELRQWELDEWNCLIFLAVLSAEPETWEDLDIALKRYLPQHRLISQGRPLEDPSEVTTGGNWCLIDLRGKTVVLGDSFPAFENGTLCSRESEAPARKVGHRAIESREGTVRGASVVWMEIPPHWHLQEAMTGWEQVVSHRAAVAAETSRVDSRAVLQGDPLFRYLAEQVMASEPVPAWNSEQQYRVTVKIHADWLMTPRDDLAGRIPREILHEARERMQWELERRGRQWSQQGFPPPGLPRDSAAYRYAPWGTAEVVLYFDMIRSVMEEAWHLRRRAVADVPGPAEAVSADLAVPRTVEEMAAALATCADRWWNGAEEEDPDELTRRVMVEWERRKIPISGEPPFADDQPMGGKFGPHLIWFDGHHLELDDEFAFSLITDRDEWEEIQGSYA